MSDPCLLFEVQVDPRACTVEVDVEPPAAVEVPVGEPQVVFAISKGDKGDKGDPGPGSPFLIMTQEAYDALPVKDPDLVYITKIG